MKRSLLTTAIAATLAANEVSTVTATKSPDKSPNKGEDEKTITAAPHGSNISEGGYRTLPTCRD